MNSRPWLLAFFLAACGRPEAVPPPPAARAAATVLAFGDSLTAGKDLEDPDAEAYPAVLERLLRAKGFDVSVVNAGVSGDTTSDALARLDWSLSEEPDVLLVALGSNDTFQGKKVGDIERNLEAIAARAREKGAVPVLAAMKTFPNLGPYYGSDYEALFARVAGRTGAVLAPFMLEGVAGVPALNLSDGIHPNAAGHRRVAENLLPALEGVLKGKKDGFRRISR